MNHMAGICLPLSDPRFTPKQGQYLAFIYAYTQVLSRGDLTVMAVYANGGGLAWL